MAKRDNGEDVTSLPAGHPGRPAVEVFIKPKPVKK